MNFYTNSTISIKAAENASLMAFKVVGGTTTASTVNVSESGLSFYFSASEAGDYRWQQYDNDGGCVASGCFTVLQDLAHAPADFDPRSAAEITLDALDAKIAGRALTIQQTKVAIGDRSIDYMNSIEELLKWREHFARIVREEREICDAKTEYCIMGGIR